MNPFMFKKNFLILFTEPNFVGSFDVGEYVYFFFREHAVEYINCGKAIYSRIARVCKNDRGGKYMISQNWATYLKARINCSISSEFPFYFNEIQSVYKMPNDDTKFYATFTTNTHGIVGSAVCSFDIRDINAAFEGKLKNENRIVCGSTARACGGLTYEVSTAGSNFAFFAY